MSIALLAGACSFVAWSKSDVADLPACLASQSSPATSARDASDAAPTCPARFAWLSGGLQVIGRP